MIIRPERTWALVVGIEEYPNLPKWWLPGPAKDSIRFVNWLLARRVPPEQIRLCLSARDRSELLAELKYRPGNSASASTTQVVECGADETDIRSALDDVIGWAGELLFVFWGGHGSIDSVDKNERRRLLFADAREDNPAGLSIDGLVDMLRRKRKGSIPHQALLIDACATFHAQGKFTMEVEPYSPPRGLQQDDTVRQLTFFASRRGEAAMDLSAERTGAFSQQLLTALHAAPWGPWPPDLISVARTVQSSFGELRKTGRGSQTPILLGNDWDGNALLPSSTFSERLRNLALLRTHIDRLPLDTSAILSVFRATFPDTPKLVDIHTLDDVFDFLIARPASKASPEGGGDWPPETEFAERVREHCVASGRGDLAGLTAWVQDVPARQLTDLRRYLAAEDRKALRYLLVELSPGATLETPRVESAWLYRDGQKRYYRCWGPADFDPKDSDLERMRRLIRDTLASGVTEIAIEFVVPRQHLPWSPYEWTVDDVFKEEISSQYAVVVRWRDRLASPTGVRSGVWVDVAERLFRALEKRRTTRLEWLPPSIADRDQFFDSLKHGKCGDLLMAGHVTKNFEGLHPVMYALAGGAPAVSWWTAHVDEVAAKSELAKLLNRKSPRQLSLALKAGRKAADPRCRAICAATVLFWDHPDRNPYAEKLSPRP